jgi:hypothetical protein
VYAYPRLKTTGLEYVTLVSEEFWKGSYVRAVVKCRVCELATGP